MRHSRRQVQIGLIATPFSKTGMLERSIQKKNHTAPAKSDSERAEHDFGAICLRFEGPFGYLFYSGYIEVFTPDIPEEHEYCFGMGGQYFCGFPSGYMDLYESLPKGNGEPDLPDKSVILTKSQAEISSPDFTKRYWRIKLPFPSHISGEGEPTQVKQPFQGKQAKYVNNITEIQVSYKFVYNLDAATSKQLHLAQNTTSRECALEITYQIRPKVHTYEHAINAFKALTRMLPELDLELKPNIGHPASDSDKVRTLDAYVLNAHIILCTAPSLFITGM